MDKVALLFLLMLCAHGARADFVFEADPHTRAAPISSAVLYTAPVTAEVQRIAPAEVVSPVVSAPAVSTPVATAKVVAPVSAPPVGPVPADSEVKGDFTVALKGTPAKTKIALLPDTLKICMDPRAIKPSAVDRSAMSDFVIAHGGEASKYELSTPDAHTRAVLLLALTHLHVHASATSIRAGCSVLSASSDK